MNTWSVAAGGLAIIASLSACGGSHISPTSMNCAGYGAVPAPPRMLYPLDTAVNVPDGNFSLILSRSVKSVLLHAGNSTVVAPATSVPNPLPTPNATPVPGITPGAFAVSSLNAATTYAVSADLGSPAPGCGDITQPVGSFTTR